MRSGRINRIAQSLKAQTYLEVGVCRGDTFLDVEIPYKVAVDPAFQFAFQDYASDKMVFHQMPSDSYFAARPNESFDIIYLDGLHTYEQTLRDLLNSFLVSHRRTVWLIDDTVPNDSFSALPDDQRCFRLRHSTGNMDWSWMGDVYKVVFFARTMMKFMQFRTFTGHGQTVLWREGTSLDNRDVALSHIASMTYEDMLEKSGNMNFAADEEIYRDLDRFAATTLEGS